MPTLGRSLPGLGGGAAPSWGAFALNRGSLSPISGTERPISGGRLPSFGEPAPGIGEPLPVSGPAADPLAFQKGGDLPGELDRHPLLLARLLEHEEGGHGFPVDLARLQKGREDMAQGRFKKPEEMHALFQVPKE